ncbi:MAG: redoxin domain-containing protein [Candidatus Competibacteraceae bacterium]|nr:redoxin domain-containing protein [Candidatus Competibacteraceae bacterium]
MRYVFALFLFWSLNHTAFSQNSTVTLIGKAPRLKQNSIRLFHTDDYITERQIQIAQTTLDSEGNFTLVAPLEQVSYLHLLVGSVKNPFYAEPNQTYYIEITDESGAEMFYAPPIDTLALPFRIGRFNYDYNVFTVQNYDKFITGTLREDARKFIALTDSQYQHVTHPFFQQHKTYKLAELALSSRAMGQKTLFDTYLLNKPILYHHPEYMYFFRSYYGGMLTKTVNLSKNEPIKRCVMEGGPYDTLVALIEKLELVKTHDLAELFVMQGLFELYYAGHFDKNKIEAILMQAQTSSSNTEIIKISANFIQIINRLRTGSPAIPFDGKDTEGNIISISSYFDKPVYLTFFDPLNPSSMKEIPAIKNLYDKYKKDIHFISVCSKCSYRSLHDFMQTNQLKWQFLIIDANVESEYDVFNYPTAFLLKRQGYFFRSPAELPSQGIDEYLYKVRR